jgi:hypothetical protein
MGYSEADESFTHQLPRPFDEMHHPDGSWSDRCYFFAHPPDGSLLLTNGYGNNPNQGRSMGYGKVAMADGRHWDLLASRRITASDQADLRAGPMRWTCLEPLKRWKVELGPNESGIEWEMIYEPRAPMWELLPMQVEVDGRVIVDMYHMKESGRVSGWVQIDGERTSLDGFHGGRDRTFGVRKADEINFWIWLDAGFEEHRVTAAAPHQDVNVYYGQPLPTLDYHDLGDGEYFLHFPWNSSDAEELEALEEVSMSIDQLMAFDLDGMTGHGIFEILSGSNGPARYPNWPPMDMTPFRQAASKAEA